MKDEGIDFVALINSDEERVLDKQESKLSNFAIMLYFGFCRDSVWTYAAEDECNEQQQVVLPLLGMLTGLLLLIFAQALLKYLAGSKKSVKETVVATAKQSVLPIAAGVAAIPGWNVVVEQVTHLYVSKGMSAAKAGYIAGLFPGFVEGPLQQVIITLGNFAYSAEREQYYKNSRGYLLNAGRDILLSVVPGFIPGNIWQLVYNACKTNKISTIPAIISVSFSVGMSSLGCAMLQKSIKSKSCKKTETEADSTDIKPSISWCQWTCELLLEKEPESPPPTLTV